MRERLINAGISPPKLLTLVITNGCNLNCRHCWPDSLSHETTPPVPAEDLKSVIREFVRMGLEKICLTGGEPLTHPECLDILTFCRHQSSLTEIRLQTNGSLLTQAATETLAAAGGSRLTLQVSLEGISALSHERIRGAGTFASALDGVRLLAKNGLGPRTTVAFTETRRTYDELPALMEMMEGLGIGHVMSSTLVRGGRAAAFPDLSPPTPSQYSAMVDRYLTDPHFRARYHRMATISAIEWYLGRKHTAGPCCRFIETPYLTANGTLYPCIMFHDDAVAAKEIYTRPLNEALGQVLPQWIKLVELKRFRETRLDQCKHCPGQSHCNGGCMGRAHTATGDIMTVEDRCSLRRAVYGWDRAGSGCPGIVA